VGLVGLLAGTADGVPRPVPTRERTPSPKENLIVHEWGTFLSVQGSDGGTLGGMVESEEDLPAFVLERSLGGRNRACMYQKMETPVTYFYTDRPRVVRVRAEMPHGLLTHWYPGVFAFLPALSMGLKAAPGGSSLDWNKVELIPDASSKDKPDPRLRGIPADNTWRFVRDTDSALVKVANRKRGGEPMEEYEKFLFYRGLGSFELPLEVRNRGPFRNMSEELVLRNRGKDNLAGLVMVQVEKDRIRFAALEDLAGETSRNVVLDPGLSGGKGVFAGWSSLKEGVPQVKATLVKALVKAGLYAKEAHAMVNNWEKSYFRTEGLRVLYTLPRSAVDGQVPIHISPVPDQLVRVMVGRIELLTPAKEQEIESALVQLAEKEPKARLAGQATLARLGRFREPALHRVLALTRSAQVRAKAEELLKGMAN
jgi:hypothetical protein